MFLPVLDAAVAKMDGSIVVTREPLVVLPSDHRLASREAIHPNDIAEETLLSVSHTAPVLQAVIEDYLKRSGIDTKPQHEADNLAMAMSLVASTRSVALLPADAGNFLPWSVTSRPLAGDVPGIDLVVGYNKANTSPILKLFLSRIDDLIARVSNRGSGPKLTRSRVLRSGKFQHDRSPPLHPLG